jgi:AcrR family transcriptional regulator
VAKGPAAGENTPVDNDEQAGGTQTRRRGAELEAAILDAAWEQLMAEGYEHFTIDTVAARAQTSKPVLYRRWKTREDLLQATVRHRGAADSPSVPDTGTLRGDLLALLSQANTPSNPIVALVSSMLGSYYNQSGPAPAELREAFMSQRDSAVDQVISRAVERGEIDQARLTPRIVDLPFALFRHEMMMTLKPVPGHVLRQIVDDIFIPLVAADLEPQTWAKPQDKDFSRCAGRGLRTSLERAGTSPATLSRSSHASPARTGHHSPARYRDDRRGPARGPGPGGAGRPAGPPTGHRPLRDARHTGHRRGAPR